MLSAHRSRPRSRPSHRPLTRRRARSASLLAAVLAVVFGARRAIAASSAAPSSAPVVPPIASPAANPTPAERALLPASAKPLRVELPANGPFGDSSGWAWGVDQGLKGNGIEAGMHLLAPLTEYLAVHARAYLVIEGQTGRPAGEAMLEGMLRGPVIHGLVRFYATLGVTVPFLANKLTGSTFVAPALNNLFFIGGNTGWEFFQDGHTSYFIEIGWWGGYPATRFTVPTTNPGVSLHPYVGNGPLVNGGVRFYFR